MVLINTIEIRPSILNSSCAWSSDLAQLNALYESPYTGAVTTRSATLEGFKEDACHAVAFSEDTLTTINSYGYSPHPLSQYLEWVTGILESHKQSYKPIIISLAPSNPKQLQEMLQAIQTLRKKIRDGELLPGRCRIAIELNASCPNIANSAPLGYTPAASLLPLILVLLGTFLSDSSLTIGIKMPPYVYHEQFTDFLRLLLSLVTNIDGKKRSAISFLTCTNTLGNSLLFCEQTMKAVPSERVSQQFAVPTSLGGLAGDSIHALSLGNVYTFRKLIDSKPYSDMGLGDLKIIGVGGVTSKKAAERMRKAGADAVACATLFGKEGVKAFETLSMFPLPVPTKRPQLCMTKL